MNMKNQTIERISELAKNEKYAYFFKNLSKIKDMDNSLLEELAQIITFEFNLGHNNDDKILYFLKLACIAGSNHELV